MNPSLESPAGKRPLLLWWLAQAGQIALFIVVWLLASMLVRAFSLPISAGVIGLFMVLILLFSGVLKVGSIQGGAAWMLNELVLFFIPAVVAVVKYSELFRKEGVQIVIAIVLGTVLVMAATALSVHGGCKIEDWLARRRSHAQQGTTPTTAQERKA